MGKARVSDLTAIFFACFGFTCWVLGDSCIKWIGQFGLPPEEIVAFMGLFMALTLTVQAAVRRNLELVSKTPPERDPEAGEVKEGVINGE
jgi:hypothetical protein